MAGITRDGAKILIASAPSTEHANAIVEEYLGETSFKEKIAFLKGMFECPKIIDKKDTDSDEMIYYLLLQGIIS